MRSITVSRIVPRRTRSGSLHRLFLSSALWTIGGLGAWCTVSAADLAPPKVRKLDFNRDVRPILAKNCFACHGQDEAKRAKGLRLDRREGAVKPLKSGDLAIVPGDPDSSELISRITQADESLRMPPKKAGIGLARLRSISSRVGLGKELNTRRIGHFRFRPDDRFLLSSETPGHETPSTLGFFEP